MQFQHFEVLTTPDGSPWILGRGAWGVTYKARDTNLRSDVALRVLGPEVDAETRERFLRQARAAAALRHTNVASVYHLGEVDGSCFYAMEFIEGRTLEARLAETGKITPAQALDIAMQIARALAAASRQNLVHRDIKPANITLIRDDDGRTIVKMIDFGLARLIAIPGTAPGFCGTPEYASPELVQGGPVDQRTDIYSLGATLYHMLTGRPPFTGEPDAVCAAQVHDSIPSEPLESVRADIRDLVLQMLAKDPGSRPQTPTVLRTALEACVGSVGSAATIPQVAPPPLPPAPKVHRARPAIAAVFLVLLAIGAAGWFIVKNSTFEYSVVQQTVVLPAPPPPPISLPSPSPSPAGPTVDSLLEPLEALMAKESYLDAMTLALRAQREFPTSDLPQQKMEMIAALLRSNAFVMTPAKFKTLRPSLEEAAALDVVSAQVLLGEQLRDSDPVVALRWFQAAARNGQTEAMTQTGLMLSNGKGISAPDPALAVEWFEKASEAGDTDAMTALAECLIRGKGVEKNPSRAAGMLHAAIAFEHPLAFNLLGDLYLRGIGVPENPAEALRLFTRGSELGSGDAMANLGLLYLRGQGVAKNPEKAAAIWKSGAERGFAACMLNYAKALASGSGVPANETEARKWFVEAARAGKTEAIDWCQKNNVPF